MRSSTRSSMYFASVVLVPAAFICVLAVCFAGQPQGETPAEERAGGNSKCYVCHRSMKTEEITTGHLAIDVTCDECHGASTEHMHDEMLMTKPDLLFGRSEVKKMCSNPTCHKAGEGREFYGLKDHKNPAAAEAFFKQWLGRTRPNGRTVTADSVCTDCHGKHNLDNAVATRAEKEESAEWTAAFNGRDLTGWRPSGDAAWQIKAGRIVASSAPNGKGGILWTEAIYEDYRFSVTFRADRPIHAGIYIRSEDSKTGPRVEILNSDKPAAYTGSVFVPGRGLALLNMREDLLDNEGWNTISLKVEADRVQVWLNGEEIGAVRAPAPAKGRIGFYIEGGASSESGSFTIREVMVQKLGDPQEQAPKGAGS